MKKRQSPPPAPQQARPSSEERLDWLLTFLRRDLTTLRPGEWLDLADDVWRQLLHDPAVDVAPPNSYDLALAKRKGAPDIPWPESVVIEVQSKLRVGIERLESGRRRWQPFDKPMNPVLVVQEDGTIAWRYEGDLGTALL